MSPVTGEMGGCNQSKKVTERYEKKDNDSIFSHELDPSFMPRSCEA